MTRFTRHSISAAVVAGTLAAVFLPATALAYDSHDFTTTASTAGTTAYIVGKHEDDDDFAQAERFARSQRLALRREAAAGGGEHTASLAQLLHADDPQAFGQWMQSHYADLYDAPSSSKTNLVDRIVALKRA